MSSPHGAASVTAHTSDVTYFGHLQHRHAKLIWSLQALFPKMDTLNCLCKDRRHPVLDSIDDASDVTCVLSMIVPNCLI